MSFETKFLHKSVIYKEPKMQLWAVLFFFNNCNFTLHVSDAFCAHHQEH